MTGYYLLNASLGCGYLPVVGYTLESGKKLQCLYGNPMANNFFQN